MVAIEYTYERDGEIVVGGIESDQETEQANCSGFASLYFDTLELPDGTTEKTNGGAMGPDFAAIRE